MDAPSSVVVPGPLSEHAAGFRVELERLGYTAGSARAQMSLLAHLSRWLEAGGLGAGDVTGGLAEAFLADRRAAGYAAFRSSRALVPLLSYLRQLGAVPPVPEPAPPGPVDTLLASFVKYLVVERGLVPATAADYARKARPFLAPRAAGGWEGLAALTAAEVTRFIVDTCPGMRRGTAKLTVSALRSVLGWLHVSGQIPAPLAWAVPAVATWRNTGLPEPVAPGQVQAMIASCDLGTPAGLRDRAILVLLARLGLRAGEVAGLVLEDIDWRAGELIVRGKGRRDERMPLPADVGEAIAAWLTAGRPGPLEEARQVFLRVLAPHRGLTTGGVTQAVFAAGQRAGAGKVYAHRLRHSAATGMLRAGVPLAHVGQVLRHRRLLSTAIYAKADLDALRSIARPWPAGDGR